MQKHRHEDLTKNAASDSTAMPNSNNGTKKRYRSEEIDCFPDNVQHQQQQRQQQVERSPENATTTTVLGSYSGSAAAAPPYGSKEYWEARYIRQFEQKLEPTERLFLESKIEDEMMNTQQRPTIPGNDNEAGNSDENEYSETSLPYHSWYYDYNDLRSLILPLILGGQDDAFRVMSNNNNDKDDHVNYNNDKRDPSDKEGDDTEDGVGESELAQDDNPSPVENIQQIGNDDAHTNDHNRCNTNADKEKDDGRDIDGDTRRSSKDDDNDNGNSYADSCDNDDDDVSSSNSDDNQNDEVEDRDGLASMKNGPINVLEIGCGDVPLGVGLATELRKLQNITGVSVHNVVNQILCTDYSKVVVDKMNQQHCSSCNDEGAVDGDDTCDKTKTHILSHDHAVNEDMNQPNRGSIMNISKDVPIRFEVTDARRFPYGNGSFEFILEKGTLDAMLSDKDCGVSNCIQIISECARLLTPKTKTICRISNDDDYEETNSKLHSNQNKTLNSSIHKEQQPVESFPLSSSEAGCLFLVSHMNANTAAGMHWLNDIIIAGLLQGTKDHDDYATIEWDIEVHGSSELVGDGHDDEDNNNEESMMIDDPDANGSPGPAVYIIHKRIRKDNPIHVDDEKNDDDDSGKEMDISIPIRFFSY